jgi:hypothetical protein
MKAIKFKHLALFSALLAAGAVDSAERIELRGAELYDNGVTPARVAVDMSRLPAYPEWKPGDPIKEIPQRKGLPRDYVEPMTDPQPQRENPLRALNNRIPQQSGGVGFDIPLVNRNGSGFTGVNPPDTIGDVGNEHFIQMINGGGTRVLILDKIDGTTVADFALSSLATGSGTGCTSGSGDPIVMFDETVDNGPGEPRGRWFLSEFTGNSFCVYISQTADPTTGDWFIYEFGSASGGLPDYPKWAVWPDAYYIGANENAGSIPGNGRTVYAFDRESMLQGVTTRPAQVFEIPALSGFGFQMIQPADWDGILPPPAGTPGLFVRHRDDEVHNGGSSDPTRDFLELWEFDVDWDTPANSTFTGPTNIGVEDFESELCGLTAFACVPQPGTGTELDPLREPVMWRAQFRNFGSHQVIVGSWVTDAVGGAADVHGVQWAELRNTGGGWQLFQEGLVSPDNVNRWMSSIAMDGTGNIAMGYNVSDATATFPGLRYIGRLTSDPLDTMSRGEFTLVDGSGSNASNRYGDYSAIAVDPVDECTFWFTGQYNTGPQCGEPGFALNSPGAVGGVCTAAAADDFVAGIDVLSVSDFTGAVTLAFDPALPTGFSGGFSPNPVNAGNASTATVTVQQSVAAGDYPLTVLGTAAGASDRTLDLLLTVNTSAPGAFSLTAPVDGAFNVGRAPLLQWTASDQVGEYLVQIATDPAFTNVVYQATETGTSHQVATPLASSTEYYWHVIPSNFCGDLPMVQVFSFTTQPEPGDCPIGQAALNVFSDDMENGANGWTLGDGSIQNTWQQSTVNAVSGTTAWNAENLASISDQRLVSPTIQLPGSALLPLTLRFWNRQELEDAAGACWDAGLLEISTNGGVDWTELSDPRVLFRPHDGIVNTFATGPNPLAGSPGWCGDPRDWEDYVIDLSDFAGEEIQLRFRVGTDGTVGAREGWTIDDVRIEACGGETIFEDGFESPGPIR